MRYSPRGRKESNMTERLNFSPSRSLSHSTKELSKYDHIKHFEMENILNSLGGPNVVIRICKRKIAGSESWKRLPLWLRQ